MTGLTLKQRYYGINAALNSYLVSKGQQCKVLKYGIDRATLKNSTSNQTDKYPYLQTYVNNAKPVSWTNYENGVLTDFDFQISFFTSPATEFEKDDKLFEPFYIATNALSDARLKLLQTTIGANVTTLADLISVRYTEEFGIVSGAPVPSAIFIAKMRAVCGYVPDPSYVPVGYSTNIDQAISYTME